MNEIFIARQPIFNRNLDVIAYELLYRSGNAQQANIENADEATSELLVNALVDIGLPEIIGDKLAFVNMTRRFITGEIPFPLEQRQFVWEVLEDIESDPEIIKGLLIAGMNNGFPIALDDFIYSESNSALIELADFIKLDVLSMDRATLEQHLRLLRRYDVKLLAEKVETQDMFDYCLDQGFDYFQGYFLCKPRLIQGQRVASNRLSTLMLLAEIQDPNITMKELENTISKDVSLSYRILKYVNSARFKLDVEIESIQQAIALLGVQALRTLVTMVALSKFDGKPHALMQTSLTRAKMCELLAKSLHKSSASDFVVGLFSVLDALADQSMPEVLQQLPLAEPVKAALLYGEGPTGEVLSAVLAYEQGDWSTLDAMNIDAKLIHNDYMEAIRWSDHTCQHLLLKQAA